MKRNTWFASIVFIAAMLLTIPPRLIAEPLTPVQEKFAKEIFFEIISPFCPGRSLHDCPSSSAVELKDEIRSMINKGKSREEIITLLSDRFGQNIRAVPSTSGFQSLAWAAPIAFLVLGGVLLTLWLQNRAAKSGPDSSLPSVPPLDPEMQKRIDRELSR
jgi:cytochrome c-type biogenesis protein CcmH